MAPYEARQSGATNVIAAGVPVGALQRLLGHAVGGFTLRRYVHPGEVEISMAMDALAALHDGSRAQSVSNVRLLPEKARKDAAK